MNFAEPADTVLHAENPLTQTENLKVVAAYSKTRLPHVGPDSGRGKRYSFGKKCRATLYFRICESDL
jgi:hypothetical protein